MTLQQAAWHALGTNVALLVNDGPLAPARAAVGRLLDEVDACYSRYRPDSELNRLQAAGHGVASTLLARAVEAGMRGAQLTDGLVDPTVGRALRVAGYDIDYRLMVARGALPAATFEAVPGWRALEWQPGTRYLRIPRGIELDFGSTGKALAVDLAADAALAALPSDCGVLVGIGGDIRVAGRPPAGGWLVLLAEDSSASPDEEGELARLDTGGLATSSTTVRTWRAGQVELHHLLDPRSGAPIEGPWRTATAVADTCLDANICATAALILGGAAIAWLDARGVPARLVSRFGLARYVGPWRTDGAVSSAA